MPELPDVEAFRKVLASCAQDAVIRRVDVYDTGVLHDVSAARLRRELTGRSFAAPERHGKWLLARTSGDDDADGSPTVLLHFGMTGRLVCCAPGEERHAHDRVVFTVAPAQRGRHERELRYRDQRKLKGLWLVDDAGAKRMLADQGPDAAQVSQAEFDERLARRRGGVKSALTDQSLLAGLGNLLADELLWRARLAPDTPVGTLTDADRARLYKEMRSTLKATVQAGRIPDRATWLTGHRDDDPARCPRCGTGLRRDRVSGRATVWCPHCQPRDGKRS
ncbi:DNA-formamidopyrimidine glycosylase family protein [Streptomyces odontomachi]|uniref:DNA-formamidopyrimidine glycosylase family protein n=1 Tax=Streptomyces odontomachi TaxID=2944940 RepID=UPI00210AB37B|nr:DNA-formamidopyrimidine glycosylase family protein [Streptomyces sp. ODS25]